MLKCRTKLACRLLTLMIFQAPESLSEQIAQHLGLRIIKGGLKAKERIQELKIAKELEVSRGSVREALLILERRHLVNIYPRKGAVVSELSAHHVNCLYDIYIKLLQMLISTFAERWKESDLNQMISLIEVLNKLTSSPEKPVEKIVDVGFELLGMMYPIVNNPYLEETLENLKPGISRVYYLAMNRRKDELHHPREFFDQLVSGIVKRDHISVNKAVEAYGEIQRSLALKALQELEPSGANQFNDS